MAVLFEKTSLRPSLNMLIMMFPYGGIISFIAIYGEERGIYEVAASFFILCGAGIALTRYFAGKIFDRQGPEKLMLAAILVETLSFPALVLIPGEIGFWMAAFLLGLGVGTIMPTIQAMVNAMVPKERRGAANSTLFTAIDLGIGSGMLGMGLLGKWIGLDWGFLFCIAVCLLGLVYYLLVVNRYYHKKVGAITLNQT
jgi:MFS family permease